MPAAEDSGTAIGAAYYGLWQLLGYTPTSQQRVDSVGRLYSAKVVDQAIRSSPGVIRHKKTNLVEAACNAIAEGKVLGWFQRGSELGPRALGQRSIICDPRDHRMKDVLNKNVKFREDFRPFAPMIRAEDVGDWFQLDSNADSPFMLRVMRFLPEQALRVPAVVHIDGTGRVQTVSRKFAPRLHDLLSLWKSKVNIPILLNTSLNIAGEPIAETPEDALWCLLYTKMDCCVIGERFVTKDCAEDWLLDCIPVCKWESLELVDSSGVTNPAIPIPDLSSTSGTVVSAHISRLQGETHYAVDHLRLVVKKPFGDVVHAVSPSFLRILEIIDGVFTVGQIYECLVGSLNRVSTRGYSLDSFKKHLSLLKRTGAIAFIRKPKHHTIVDPPVPTVVSQSQCPQVPSGTKRRHVSTVSAQSTMTTDPARMRMFSCFNE